MDTYTNLAITADAIVGRSVPLRFNAEPNVVRSKVYIDTIRHEWFDYFMGHLASIGYNGDIDWEFEWTDGQHCLALQELSHPDNAVAVVSSIALDQTLMYGNDGWLYSWYTRFGTHCGRTMLKGSYLMDATFYKQGMQKIGWRLVMPLMNTNELHNVRHALPSNVSSWQAMMPLAEQVG